MPGDERTQETGIGLNPEDGPLAHGEIEVLGLMPNASNYTFLARVRDGDAESLAIYKPEAGEAPLWDFPDGTLSLREVAAYEVAAFLGWPNVPMTVLRDGPHGPGSLQRFVRFVPDEHYFTLRDTRLDDFRPVALFDAVVNNADRKSGHCLLGADGRIWLIDHGVCFHVEPKLRSVVWDFADEEVPSELLAGLERLSQGLRSGSLGATLGLLLADMEVDALTDRVDALLDARRFPLPGSERHFPWPPV